MNISRHSILRVTVSLNVVVLMTMSTIMGMDDGYTPKAFSGFDQMIDKVMGNFDKGMLTKGLADQAQIYLISMNRLARKKFLELYKEHIIDNAEAAAQNKSTVKQIESAMLGLNLLSCILSE